MAKGMAFASVIDWSLFCGLEICGLFASLPIMFNISFYGFASTGFFFSVCLLLSFKILQDGRIFLPHLCVQGALPIFSLSAFCLCFFVFVCLILIQFIYLFFTFTFLGMFLKCRL